MVKKLILGSVVVYVLVVLLDYVVNNIAMMSVYMQTPELWRKPEEVKLGVIFLTEAFFAFFFTLIFSYGYKGNGPIEGARYGLYVSLMMTLTGAYMTYATMPVSYELALKWLLFGIVQNMIYGIALALVYGKQPAGAK